MVGQCVCDMIRPVASLLIIGGSFSSDFGPFSQGLKISVPSGCLGETSIFQILMIDDVTLWLKLEVYSIFRHNSVSYTDDSRS